MNLGLCIANLLRQYQEVTVPGIGVFRKTPVEAAFDADAHTFSAPVNRIELIEGRDGGLLLTDYVKAQQQVNDETAGRVLDEAVQGLVAAARRNGRVLLSGLGYLIADGASLMFEQLNPAGLALPPMKARVSGMPEAQEGNEVETPAETTEPAAPVVQEVVEDSGEAIDEGVLMDGEPRSRRAIWWVAAAAVLLVAGGIWFYRPSWLAEIGEKEASTVPVSEDAPAVAETGLPDTAMANQPITAAAGITADSLPASADTVVPVTPAKPSVTYEIIVGSFATMRQAKKYVAEMKVRGYELKTIDSRMPGNRKKISWASFATEEEAYRELVSVQKNFEPEAWIAKVVHD